MVTIIAKTRAGQEFIYSKRNSYSVSKASANRIAEAMNKAQWNIQQGEKWHVYEIGEWEKDYMAAGYQRLSIYKGHIKAHYN